MKSATALAAGAIFAFSCAAAHALPVTQVFSPSQLNGALVVEDFEDEAFVPGVTFLSNSGIQRFTSAAASGDVTTSGIWGLSTTNSPEPIVFEFALSQPAGSVGMFFGNDDACCASTFTAYLDVFGAPGLLGTIGVEANMNDYVDQFLGVNSDTPITSVQLRYGSGFDVALYHFVDDFQFAVVPEPPGMLALAWVVAGALARHRPSRRSDLLLWAGGTEQTFNGGAQRSS
ncbi:MAG TPA: hypothetical protein VGK58_15135 [Lacipirellulaceae bacterium]